MTKAFFAFILLVLAGTANAEFTVECQVGETWVDSFDLIFLTASTNGTVNIDGNTRTAKHLAFEADDGKLYWRWNFSDFSRRYVLVLGSDFRVAL